MVLVLVGISHHAAPIAVRERLSCPDSLLPGALTAAAACPGVQEAAILSTCNRMEIYAVTETPDAATAYALLSAHLVRFYQVPEATFAPYLYRKVDHEAVSHLLRVASGLDSLVLGEAQILGQVRTVLKAAEEAGTLGSTLHTLFQQAISGGKRVHTETALGRGAFSIGRAAVDLARGIFDDLSRATVLILGAGKMSELTVRYLVQNGVHFVVVANRTYEKAVTLAERLGGKAIQYDLFAEALLTTDIVISSTAAPHPILRREMLAPIMRRRRGRPLFLIDIAMPRDIDPDVADLENVFLYNIDDLQAVVVEEAKERAAEAVRAEAIAADEAAKFLAWYRTREAAPVITQLRDRLEQIRQDDLAQLRARLGHLSEREWQAIETATRAMMNRVAREPILRLKQASSETDSGTARYDLLSAAREIFGLAAASNHHEAGALPPEEAAPAETDAPDEPVPPDTAEVTP
ncbi:MAG TPA: glutamyl-tRNA reductase [Chthonomonadaceae bacterium]|nr:glutamyl-tRNA reductase [Chthonomonadaceae bacterium]